MNFGVFVPRNDNLELFEFSCVLVYEFPGFELKFSVSIDELRLS